MTFKQVEPLKFDGKRSASIEALEDGTQFVDLSDESEKQYWYLMHDEAVALWDFLSVALGYMTDRTKEPG